MPIINMELASKSDLVREIGRFVFPIVWFACVGSIFLAPFLTSTVLRVGLSLIFMAAWLSTITLLGISGDSVAGGARDNQVDTGVLVLFWAQRDRLFEVAQTFPELIPSLAGFTALAIIFAWPPSRGLSVRGKWNLIVCLPLMAATSIALYSHGGTSGFPTPVGFPIRLAAAIATEIKQDEVAESIHARSVTVTPTERHFEKIIVIMDESIRAGFMDSNVSRKWNPIDYGSTVSIANCSHSSRYLFRHGFRASELPGALTERGLVSEHSTVWQYAKAAGYRTVLIDALGEGVFHSGINSDELSYIDEKIYITSRPLFMRDFDALHKLQRILARPGRDFIWLDKQGAHHPYQLRHPPEAASSFEGPPVKSPEAQEWREYQRELLARYRKAIDWSVNKFLLELFEAGVPANTLFVYTSDHGQSLSENGTKWPHCSSGSMTVDGEGLVPLVFFTSQDSALSRILRANSTNHNGKYSQFELFPTLLVALGFPPSWVKSTYGDSLIDPPPVQRSFLKGGDVRRLEWHRVD